MTIEGLKCFIAVVDTGSFHNAAKALMRTQPAVSQQIKALELESGGQLIDRKNSQLTARGKILYEKARTLLAQIENIGKQLDDFDEEAHRELRIGTSDTTARYTLPPVLKRFLKSHPKTSITLINRNSSAIQSEVLESKLDLGIVTNHTPRKFLHYEPLFKQRLVVAVPKKHPFTSKRSLTLEKVAGERLLILDNASRSGMLIRTIFSDAGLTPKVLLDSGSYEVIKAYIAAGMGISIIPEIMVTNSDTSIRSIRMKQLPHIPVGIIYKDGSFLGRGLQDFIRLLKTVKVG